MPTETLTPNAPGFVCPFCGTDASPIAPTPPCEHLFVVDGENGWRLTERSRPLLADADAKRPALFRDLLYHDPTCRAHLRLLRADYDDALEMFVWSDAPEQTARAFARAIAAE